MRAGTPRVKVFMAAWVKEDIDEVEFIKESFGRLTV